MDSKKLSNIILQNEGAKLDFKLKVDTSIESGRKELARDICAMANSIGGRGYLIIGVEDKTKKIVGVNPLDLLEEQLQQIISSRCEPPIPISLEYVNYEDKVVGIINIFDGNQKPYQHRDNGAFYIRRGSTTDTMRKYEIISAMEENLSFNSELCPIINSNIDAIDKELVDKYFSLHNIQCNDSNRKFLMESTSIIKFDHEKDAYVGTLGGLLIFSKVNYLFIPHNMIKIINKINKNIDDVIIIQGDLLSMLKESMNLLKEIFPKEYPIEGIYEGIKNAILYRDYNTYFREIELTIEKNSTILSSPGLLLKSIDVNSPNYIKRNMWIYEKLIILEEKLVYSNVITGFKKMKKLFKRYGNVIFINGADDGNFKVIYPGVNSLKK